MGCRLFDCLGMCAWMGYVDSSRTMLDLPLTGSTLAAINLTLVFCMGTDLHGILNSPIGQPMATVCQFLLQVVNNAVTLPQILFNSFRQRGTLVIWAFVIIVQ